MKQFVDELIKVHEYLISNNLDRLTDYGIENSPEDFRSKDTWEADQERYIENLSVSEIVDILNELDNK